MSRSISRVGVASIRMLKLQKVRPPCRF